MPDPWAMAGLSQQAREPQDRPGRLRYHKSEPGLTTTHGRRMTMKGMNRGALVLGLVACSAVTVEAGELSGPGDEVTSEIVVVSEYQTQVLVYVEDSDGRRLLLGRVSHGEVKHFDVPADVIERGDFRVKVYPIYNADPWSGWNDLGIKTRALNFENGETVILWIGRDLTESTVEVRTG